MHEQQIPKGQATAMWGHGDTDIARDWVRVRGALRRELGESIYDNWINRLTLSEIIGRCVRIAAPTRFIRDFVEQSFGQSLSECWRQESTVVDDVEIIVEPRRPAEVPAGSKSPVSVVPAMRRASANGQDRRDTLGAAFNRRFTFESFVVGTSNELAHAAARRAADSESVTFNPLFLYGPVGLGKTHLMHAIAWQIRKRFPQRHVMLITAERFMSEFVSATKANNAIAFKDRLRSVDVLMIDDVHFIDGKQGTQAEFIHTFNELVEQNRQVIVSADKSPVGLSGIADQLRSRLSWGLVVDISPTDYALRLAILQMKAKQVEQPIPEKVLEFLAHKITSNVRELEGSLTRIAMQSSLHNRPITVDAAQEMLQDLLPVQDRRVTIEAIQTCVAKHYGIRVEDMHSPRRAIEVARPRQIAMFLSKQLTTRSLPQIGRQFGGRDHTTVMHAVKRVKELRAADRELDENVELLRRLLGS